MISNIKVKLILKLEIHKTYWKGIEVLITWFYECYCKTDVSRFRYIAKIYTRVNFTSFMSCNLKHKVFCIKTSSYDNTEAFGLNDLWHLWFGWKWYLKCIPGHCFIHFEFGQMIVEDAVTTPMFCQRIFWFQFSRPRVFSTWFRFRCWESMF